MAGFIFKEALIKKKLGKCAKCPFLEITDVENEKVYCFLKVGNICVEDMVTEMRTESANNRKKNR